MASYNILLKSCCLAARVDLAQEIYREAEYLESKGSLKLDVFTYTTLVKVPYSFLHCLQQVLQSIIFLQNNVLAAKIVTCVVFMFVIKSQVFADARMWQMALAMKEKMLEAGVTPNAITWSSLISACAKAGLVDQAFALFEEMVLANCMPNSQCCNVLIYACVKAFQYDRAFRLFQSWKRNSFQMAFGDNYTANRQSLSKEGSQIDMKVPFRPTTSTYNVLMKACGTDHLRAKALMDEMKRFGLCPNHISWSTLIGVYGGSGDVKSAVQVRAAVRFIGSSNF